VSRIAAVFCALLSCALSSCGSEEPRVSVRESSAPIENGSSAPNEPSIVAIVPRRLRCEDAFSIPSCTGVLIGDRAVLTAGHCLEIAPRGTLEVYVGDVVGEGSGPTRRIIGHVLHPRYDRVSSEFDLGIAWLDAKLDVPPVPLPAVSLDASSVGRTARVVGFGANATRRQGTVRLSAVESGTLSYEPSPAMTCRGDSGGPVFVTEGAGEALVSLTSSGDLACMRFGIGPRLDLLAATFLAPTLAAGPPAPADPSLEGLCQRSCAVDADCPGDLLCRTDEDGSSRCRLLDRPSSAFSNACVRGDECESGRCARVGDGCRCEAACATPPPSPPDAHDGCTIGAAPRGSAAGFALLVLAASLVRLRKCSRSRPRDRHAADQGA